MGKYEKSNRPCKLCDGETIFMGFVGSDWMTKKHGEDVEMWQCVQCSKIWFRV